MTKSKTMLNYPTQSVSGGVFYPKGCVSQLLTDPTS
jgi:hypothetical protein